MSFLIALSIVLYLFVGVKHMRRAGGALAMISYEHPRLALFMMIVMVVFWPISTLAILAIIACIKE